MYARMVRKSPSQSQEILEQGDGLGWSTCSQPENLGNATGSTPHVTRFIIVGILILTDR
jgi:hypothetical protein